MKGAISPLFHNIFNICLTSRVQLHLHLLNAVVRFIFFSSLQIWYDEVRISRNIFESPLEFEITRVDCTMPISSHFTEDKQKIQFTHNVQCRYIFSKRDCFCKMASLVSESLSKLRLHCEKGGESFEPAHSKTYNKTYVTSKGSDQLVHPPSMARVLIYPSLDSLEAVEGICYQQTLIRLWRCTGWS